MNFSADIIGRKIVVPTRYGKRPYIHFDNAATTPACAAARDSVTELLPYYGSVHRGAGIKSEITTSAYEDARRVVKGFFGATAEEHTVIFTKNTTEAINKLARQFPFERDSIVLVSGMEHHSNDLPWRRSAIVKRIAVTPKGEIDEAHYLSLLRQYNRRIRLVAVTGASNVTGAMPDIHWMASKAHEVGAQIAVDCAQLAAHKSINMGSLEDPRHIDYIAVSGHKMYAPFGSGALVARKDAFMHGQPDHVGGGTVKFVTPTSVDWAETPARDEAGTPNVIGANALAHAAKFLQAIGFEKIAEQEKYLTKYTLLQLQKIPGITIYGSTDTARLATRSSIIPVTVEGAPPHLVAAVLGHEYGIGVRSGCFCAQPYVADLLKVSPADIAQLRKNALSDQEQLPGLVRISLSFYNTTEEVDRLIEALKAVAALSFGKYTFEASTGSYIPDF